MSEMSAIRAHDLIVRGGTVVLENGVYRADLAVTDGKVVALGQNLGPAEHYVDAQHLHVLPGLVDLHVHFREPGMEYKEDFGTGSLAAAMGGVTTVFEMPNTIPPTATVELFKAKAAAVGRHAYVDYGLRGIVAPDNGDELEALVAEGAAGFKLFMGETVGGNPCPDDGQIYAAFRTLARTGTLVSCHAENNPVLQRLVADLQAAGRTDAIAHLESRPAFVEQEAVARACVLAAAAGNRLHVHHLSSAAGLEAVRWGRSIGAKVTCEALVGHLLLDDSAYARHGNLIKLNPPIRAAEHVDALWRGIATGEIEAIATDHAPHSKEEQARADVWAAHGGFIGVETMLPLLTTQVAAGRLTLPRLVELTCSNPARIQRVYPQKGNLLIGADADFVLVDMASRYRLDDQKLHSKHPVTPYHDWEIVGRPVATYLRGRAVVRDAELVSPPLGRLVYPQAGVADDTSFPASALRRREEAPMIAGYLPTSNSDRERTSNLR